ncbi:hypothetical protein CCACVL1_30019 [Corchorus capsularis]|uniref:Uncharacterized protein n=1 Tax=Corchorus capsularis TaxID=210143 RepID=A0A1R3FZ27_COCAP|nr:hypothetical protein CCACVL1_30019 [Corchorus capsularis]
MSLPLLGVEEEGQSNISSPSVDNSDVLSLPEENKSNLNLYKAELRSVLPV